MKQESISLKEAQSLILSSQKLAGAPPSPLEIIEHLGYVQIDTISVIERAHHPVFWTRNHKYEPSDLDQLVSSRKVFEYWSHAAAYLPMNEYRFSLPMKKLFQESENSWFPKDPKLMSFVLKRIQDEGPLRSKDFKNTNDGKSGWWDWKPAKKTLERLFMEGKLEITKRDGFQKVYDLPERVIPSSVNTEMPNESEYINFLIRRTLRHHGLANPNEMAYLQKKDIKNKVSKEIDHLLESGDITQVQVENIQGKYFTTNDALNHVTQPTSQIFIFSPFDNLIIQRKKLSTFFNFDYQIECYVPAPKRKYGYFCLPIFIGRKPVARIDCKAYRNNKEFIVHSIHYERKEDKNSPSLHKKIQSKLNLFAKFNNCTLASNLMI